MHNKHEGKEEGILTMVISQGLFILGKLVGGNKLTDPRVFSIIDNGSRIQMAPLPGTPPFITLGNDGMRFTMPDVEHNKNIIDLYHKVTHPQPDPGSFLVKPTLVTPDITGKLN